MPAVIDDSEMVSKPEVVANRTITLFCPASGTPVPQIQWYRDAEQIVKNTSDVFLMDNGWRLRIESADEGHTGRYSCRAKNVAGESEKYFDLLVLGESNTRLEYINN